MKSARFPRSLRRSGAALVLCALAAGCSSGASAAATAPSVTIGHPTVADDIRLPYDSYFFTPSQEDAILHATDILEISCLRRFGFSATVPPTSTSQYNAIVQSRYYVSDIADAEAYGYMSPPADQPPSTSASTNYSSTEEMVLTGRGASSWQGKTVPTGGCAGEAEQKLTAGEKTIVDKDGPQSPDLPAVGEFVPGDLAQNSYAAAASDARVQKLYSGWSACMEASGFAYKTPEQANNDSRWSSTDTPTQLEVATAVADVKCKTKVNYLGVLSGVQAAYEQQSIERNAQVLADCRRNMKIELQNVAAVIAGTSQ